MCSMGFLRCNKSYRYELYTLPRAPLCGDPLSLINLLSPNRIRNRSRSHERRKLSRKARKQLSVQVPISLLQLYTTPWITSEWSRNDIVFENIPDATHSSSVLQPYLRRRLLTVCETSPETILKNTQAVIFQLGLLLLELCIGETLEGDCVSPNANPEVQTGYDELVEVARNEEGDEIAVVIEKCLKFGFQSRSKSLLDEELRKAVYNEVVVPLRDVPRNFNVY